MVTLCVSSVYGQGRLNCFVPQGGFNCSGIGSSNRYIVCNLRSDRDMFNNIVHYRPGCLAIQEYKTGKKNELTCVADRYPSLTTNTIPSNVDCLCASTLCFYRSYLKRVLLAVRSEVVYPRMKPSITTPTLPPSPTPSPSPTPPPGDLTCWTCSGKAACRQLSNMDISCTIPDTSRCSQVRVNSDKKLCVIQLDVSLRNVSLESVSFTAGTEVRPPHIIINTFEPILNDSNRASFIGRSENQSSNTGLVIPSVYWQGLTRHNEPIQCYAGCGDVLDCNPTTKSFCQIPQNQLQSKCELRIVSSKFQSCQLAINISPGGFVLYTLNVLSGTVDDPQECIGTVVNNSTELTTYTCQCRRSFCNGIIRII